MITEIVKLINSMNLGIPCDFGYKDTQDNSIFVNDTLNKGTSQHSIGERLQILIQITEVNDGYLKCREIADKICEELHKNNSIYGISQHYVGESGTKQQYSINLSCGGI